MRPSEMDGLVSGAHNGTVLKYVRKTNAGEQKKWLFLFEGVKWQRRWCSLVLYLKGWELGADLLARLLSMRDRKWLDGMATHGWALKVYIHYTAAITTSPPFRMSVVVFETCNQRNVGASVIMSRYQTHVDVPASQAEAEKQIKKEVVISFIFSICQRSTSVTALLPTWKGKKKNVGKYTSCQSATSACPARWGKQEEGN